MNEEREPKPARELRVRDLMTAVVLSESQSTPLDSTSAEMKFARIRHMPIVDDADRVVGIVSRHDVTRAEALNRAKLKLPAGAVMSTEVFTVGPDVPLGYAIALLIDNQISSLPVVDPANKLVGILTDTDVIRWAYTQVTGKAYVTPPIE